MFLGPDSLWRLIEFLLPLLLFVGVRTPRVAQPPASAAKEQAMLVYAQFGQKLGAYKPDLLVADAQGKPLKQISLPNIRYGYPTAWPDRALYTTLEDQIYLVNTANGQTKQLALPPEAQGKVVLNSFCYAFCEGKRWALLGSPALSQAYLIDLENGAVTDLSALLPDKETYLTYFSAAFSPDDQALFLSTTRGLWRVPTEQPTAAQRLSASNTTAIQGFTRDPAKFVYLEVGADGQNKVMAYDLAQATQEAVVKVDKQTAVAVAQQPLLALMTNNQLRLMNITTGYTQTLPLTDNGASPAQLFFSPSGKQLLVNTQRGDKNTWQLINVTDGSQRALDALDGYTLVSQRRGMPWAILADHLNGGTEVTFHAVVLNLETGALGSPLTVEHALLGTPASTPQFQDWGLFTVFTQQDQQVVQQLWLLSGQHGVPRLLAEADGVQGAFSPDGSVIVVGTAKISKTQPPIGKLQFVTTADGKHINEVDGVAAVWLQPAK